MRRQTMTVQTLRRSALKIDTADIGIGASAETVRSGYLELTSMLDRLHRRYLDVVRVELESMGINNINPSQALMLVGIGDEDIPVRDLIHRKGYQASTVSYNVKKLSEYGYLEQERAAHDRRSVRLRLSPKGREIVSRLRELEARHMEFTSGRGELLRGMENATATLRQLDQIWAEYITFG